MLVLFLDEIYAYARDLYILFRVKMAKEQPTVNLNDFSTSIRDRLLNLISWAKAVPGIL